MTLSWPQMPTFGDKSYSREDWLADTNPTQLIAECQAWKDLALAAHEQAPTLPCWRDQSIRNLLEVGRRDG